MAPPGRLTITRSPLSSAWWPGRSSAQPNNEPLENAVNQFAAKTLPVVQHHLEMAQQLEDRLDDTPRRNTTQ